MNPSEHLFVGSYTNMSWCRGVPGRGLYHLTLNPGDGTLTCLDCCSAPVNPSFSAFNADGTRLYTVNELEVEAPEDPGSLMTFAVGEDGTLTLLDTVSSHGGNPCYLACDDAHGTIFLANYLGGNLAVYAAGKDGLPRTAAVIPFSAPDAVSHMHSAVLSPDGKYLAAANLGLDTVTIFCIADDGTGICPQPLCSAQFAAGTGPRHICFSRDGRRLYLSCELSSQAAVLEFCPEEPSLRTVQLLAACPQDAKQKNSCAHLALSGDEKTLYVSNRGHNSIAVFGVSEDGLLTLRGHVCTEGETPRNFAIDPSGRWLIAANQDSDTLCSFDLQAGALPVLRRILQLPSPAHIVFAP